jgi:hypothetical protein
MERPIKELFMRDSVSPSSRLVRVQVGAVGGWMEDSGIHFGIAFTSKL